jgi:hypothetical protein
MFKAFRLTSKHGKVSYMLSTEKPSMVVMFFSKGDMDGAIGNGVEECGIKELEAAWAREDKFRKAVLSNVKYGAIV